MRSGQSRKIKKRERRFRKNIKLNGGDIFVTLPDEVHSSNMMPVLRSEIIWFQLDISMPERFLFPEPAAASALLLRMRRLKNHVYSMKTSMPMLIKEAFQCVLSGRSPWLGASYLSLILNLLTEEFHQERNTLSENFSFSRTIQNLAADKNE